MRSFSILRTNVGLTTNTKIMVSQDYDLYLESIDSVPDLSNSKYKKFRFNKDNYYDELLPYMYKGTPKDTVFAIKYDSDNNKMYQDFSNQYDDIYYMGCRNIIDNKNYSQEYECFAPLYISPNNLPKWFIIFRVDGPGLINLDKQNFKSEIVEKLKCISSFNLTGETLLGEWLNKNFVNNPSFPKEPFYLDYRNSEFSSWNGIDMTGGGYINKSFFLDSTFEYENLYFDLEKSIFDGYRNNQVAFPNILNLSFLFDDTPATPNSLRKWSLNRYMGFYFDDLEFVQGVSPYLPPSLKKDVYIDSGNLLKSTTSDTPFDETWKKVEVEYVEIGGSFYPVQKFQEVVGSSVNRVATSNRTFEDQVSDNYQTYYKVISDIDFSGLTYSSINQNIILITADNKIVKSDYSNYIITGFDEADLWLIEIDAKFHTIIRKNGAFYIQTDYAFDLSIDKLDYYINSSDPAYRKSISLVVDSNNAPKVFKIYKAVFTDIKDFDTQIVETEYSKFEYQKELDLTQTDETKMYAVDYQSTSFPKDIEDYKINDEVVNIPASSEYTANGETFRIMDNDLTPLWRKNPVRVKWGFQDSISSNDYPYLMNNSFESEDYNRTTNPFDPNPKRIERNLDYFYTINSATSSYLHHSLHVENFDVLGFKFEWDKYLNIYTYSVGTSSVLYEEDYFTQFFGQNAKFNSGNIIKKTKKWSNFNSGEGVIPNITLFRGIKFKISDVDSIKVENGNITNINTRNNNTYNDYKFSILLSKNDKTLVINPSDSKTLIGLTSASNTLQWKVIDQFKYNKTYYLGDVITYNNILYRSATASLTIVDPNRNPSNVTGWQYFTGSVFWSPGESYTDQSNPVYYNGEYYRALASSNSNSNKNFWVPGKSYANGSYVIYDSTMYISMTSSNTKQPNIKDFYFAGGTYRPYWSESSISSDIWYRIELWSNTETYTVNDYVVYNQILYKALQNNLVGIEPMPTTSDKWQRVYSMLPDTDIPYTQTNNKIILMNNRYYLCTNGNGQSTLDNGIIIYVNKKWKNVLINIYINDNTLSNLSNADRDLLYNDMYSKLTAYNFINCINNLSNKYGFVDYIKYVIIDENGSKVYSYNNVSELPLIITAESPDQLLSRIKSLDKFPKTLNVNQFKAKRKLDKANIQTIDMLNWFNDSLSLGTEIVKVKGDPTIIPYYSGLSNNIYNNLFRHSGPYCPIFYNIELFQQSVSSDGSIKNYKFDTSLTSFGLAKEQIISKVNRNSNLLQLRNKPDLKSIWPMIDEFGYTTTNFFIFKSTWDFEYHVECNEIKQVPPPVVNKFLKVNLIDKNSLL